MILLASYPKSGNTWVRALLTHYFSVDGKVDLNRLEGFPQLTSRVVFDDMMGVSSADVSPERLRQLRGAFCLSFAQARPTERFVKVHEQFDPVLFPNPPVTGVVYLVRNPLTLALSYADHQAWPVERIVEFMCDPNAGLYQQNTFNFVQLSQHLGRWDQHVQAWADRCDAPVCVIRYEDLCADPLQGLSKILLTCWGEGNPDRIAAAVRDCSLHRLAEQEKETGFQERNTRTERFFNRGEARSWKDELPTELADRIVAEFGETMERLGYL